jgi:hypothetical protein
VLPGFDAADPHQALGQFAVQIHLDDKDQEKFPIGAHGVAAIYTGGAGSRCCAKSQFARILGSTGSIRSTFDYPADRY